MAKVGRPALLVPTTDWKVRIPVDLAAKADLLHLDPVRGTPTYGARSELITRLLREYLENLSKDKKLDEGIDNLAKPAHSGDPINGDINPPINLPENSHD